MRLVCLLIVMTLVSLQTRSVMGQSIPIETLNHLKAATAFIKVDIEGSPSTGSGFLIERTGTTGLIATNAHVIDGQDKTVRSIRCVFNSGTSKEFTLKAEPIGVDASRDLAILRVSSSTLPDPIDVATEVAVHETLSVFVLGFPFGEALAASSRSPALTITPANISSIRRDDFDDLAFLQLGGGINPGNSGGPVVNADGALVGISVAKLTGTEIGLAIPRGQLHEILDGAVGNVAIAPTGTAANLRIMTIDPHDRIRSLQFYSMRKADAPNRMTRNPEGNWELVSTKMKESPVRMEGDEGKVQTDWRVDDYVFQVKIKRADGSEEFTPPRIYRGAAAMAAIQAIKRRMTESPPPSSSSSPPSGSPSGASGEILHVETFKDSITSAALAGGGKYLVLHCKLSAKVFVFDFAEQRVVAEIPAANDALVAASLDTIFIVSTFTNDCARWSFRGVKKGREGKLQIPGQVKSIAIGHSSRGPLIVNWVGRMGTVDAHISALDTGTFRATTLTPLERRSLPGSPRMRSKGEETLLRVSGNGTTVGVWNINRSPQGVEVIRLGRPVAGFYQHDSAGHIVPGPDGSVVFTGKGMFSADLVRRRGSTACFPGATPDYYVALIDGGVQVLDASGGIVAMFRSDKEFTFPRFSRKEGLQLYDRFHLVPQLNLMATIPPIDNQLVIRRVATQGSGIDEDADSTSGSRSGPDDPPETEFRTWKDKSGTYEVVAKLLGVGSSKVKLEKKEDGSEIMVPLKVLSEPDLDYVREYRRSK